jgi:hypothetical protein
MKEAVNTVESIWLEVSNIGLDMESTPAATRQSIFN